MLQQSVEEFAADMNGLAMSFGSDVSKPLDLCREPLLDGIAANFDNAQSSEGEPWPPHAPATVKRYGPHPLLILSGKMKAAATGQGEGHIARLEKDQLEMGVSKETIPYAGVHQGGWPDRNIPRRSYLGVSQDVAERCEEILADGLIEHFEG